MISKKYEIIKTNLDPGTRFEMQVQAIELLDKAFGGDYDIVIGEKRMSNVLFSVDEIIKEITKFIVENCDN